MKTHLFQYILLLTIVFACDKSNVQVIDDSNKPPSRATLIYPLNREKCQLGLDFDQKLEVTFEWNFSENTDLYELVITKNLDQTETRLSNLTTNNTRYRLDKGFSYSWKVISKNSISNTSSDIWQFYIPTNGIENTAPEPAIAIFPENGASLDFNQGQVELKWESYDYDNDHLVYTLRIDEIDGLQDPSEENIGIENNSKVIAVETDKEYYWSITTSDESISVSSKIFNFKIK